MVSKLYHSESSREVPASLFVEYWLDSGIMDLKLEIELADRVPRPELGHQIKVPVGWPNPVRTLPGDDKFNAS